MEQDIESTVVIFRKFPNGEVLAVFPELPEFRDLPHTGGYMSFAHIGQHAVASRGIMKQTKPAKPAEYASLQRELESPPYNYRLVVRLRWPSYRRSKQPK